MSKEPGENKPQSIEKENMHPRNLHRAGYNLKQLCKSSPALKRYVSVNEFETETINFANQDAVRALNQALLKHFYNIEQWNIPEGYLCPPVPGRADYIHNVADLLAEGNEGNIPKGKNIRVLDIGMGANCIYPIIGSTVYGWSFVGTDIDAMAISSAQKIIDLNKALQDKIIFRLQSNKANIFKGIVKQGEGFDLTVCNPPFHASLQEVQLSASAKWNKLGLGKQVAGLNFGGQKNELWCYGGEAGFIRRMVEQSALVAKQCLWFTTLVSKKDTLTVIHKSLKAVKAVDVKIITMQHGQKVSRVVAWTFFDEAGQADWRKQYWV